MEHSVFSAKEAGTGSGIEGQELKTAPSAEEAGLTVKRSKWFLWRILKGRSDR